MMRKIKTIIALGTATLVMTSTPVSAQDDVSIMDLKETVYLLMKDVQGMKADQKSFMKEGKEVISNNGAAIKAIQSDVVEIQRQIKKDRNRDILEGYTVSNELKKFAKKH